MSVCLHYSLLFGVVRTNTRVSEKVHGVRSIGRPITRYYRIKLSGLLKILNIDILIIVKN